MRVDSGKGKDNKVEHFDDICLFAVNVVGEVDLFGVRGHLNDVDRARICDLSHFLGLDHNRDLHRVADPNRADFVLLLTDGLPNCNPSNSSNCLNAAACKCTTTNCGTDTSAPFCTLGCLDQGGAVAAVNDLRTKDIRTIVVGFGADFGLGGDGPLVLNAMAEAGGFARGCPGGLDSECGGASNPCDQTTKLCTQKFYQAANGAALAAALQDISNLIKNVDICEFVLESTPTDQRFISVIVNGTALNRDDTTTWTYSEVGGARVRILGQYCDDLKASTVQNPVKVEIRVIETL
jgi:hypothetical protein